MVVWKNNVVLSTLHLSACGEADKAKSRFGEIILALMALKDTWLITVKRSDLHFYATLQL